MGRDAWTQVEHRGRVVAEEARCRAGGGGQVGQRWLASALTWLAEVVGPWEEVFGEGPEDRSYRLVVATPHVEAWVITWPGEGRLRLHDHGGASGCLQVVSGELVEQRSRLGAALTDGSRAMRRPLLTRAIAPGCRSTFGGDDVHDVTNRSSAPATSVHLYGPASQAMGFWEVDGGVLRPLAGVGDDARMTGEQQPA